MQLPSTRGQQVRDHFYDASGTITTGGQPQLVLPEHRSRSFLYFQNLSAVDMYLEFGAARATATLTSGKITSFSVTNAGFGYTQPPIVRLIGGGNSNNPAFLAVGAPGYPSPGDPSDVIALNRYTDLSAQRPGEAHAVLTGAAVSSIVIDNPGSGYQLAPLVFLENTLRDPYGAAIPSATSGIWIPAGSGSLYMNGTTCPTDQMAVFCATTSSAFCCKFMS